MRKQILKSEDESPSRIRLILLDGYGVAVLGGYPATCKRLGKMFSRDWKELYSILYVKYFNMAAERKITQKEAWILALQEMDINMNWKELKKLHYSFLKLNMPVIRLMKDYSRKIKTIILSKNTRSQFYETTRLTGLPKYFSEMLNTWEFGLPKASKQTMDFILERYKVKPPEVLFIDDQKENLIIPIKIGIVTIHYKDFKTLRNRLRMVMHPDRP